MAYRSPYTPEERRVRRAETRRRYYLKTKPVHHANTRRWRAANRPQVLAAYRRHDLKRYYDMTVAQWNDLFTAQGLRCAVCRSTDPGRKTGHWSTDHCHATGKVRGILCTHCNVALGQAKDNPATLRALADYVEAHDAYASGQPTISR